MVIKNITSAIVFALLFATNAMAQAERNETLIKSENNGWEYEVHAGVNIGGAAPSSMPQEIRKIKNYNPKFNGVIEGVITRWFIPNEPSFGVSTGVRIEEKGMVTEALVKNYYTAIAQNDGKIEGYYTGNVKTKFNSTLLTLPVMLNYRFNNQYKVRVGLYASYLLDGEFSGEVSDGYLREGSPIGEKLSFSDGASANYNFTENLRRFQWGAQLGGSWQVFKHLNINADFTYNFNNIFKKDFKTITFALYPMYLNIGFGYKF